MAGSRPFLDRVRQRAMRRYWTRRLEAGGITDTLRQDARKLRRILDDIERTAADANLLQSDPKDGLPGSTLWAKRPNPWAVPIPPKEPSPLAAGTKLAADTTLYHDAKTSDVLARQSVGIADAPYELSLDVAEFDGNYLSLAIALPPDQITATQRSDLIRLDTSFTATRPVNALARANIKIGPNVEVITREIDRTRAKPVVEFDIFYLDLDAQKITDVWVDLIFEKPEMNVITIHDLRLSRRPRAKT